MKRCLLLSFRVFLARTLIAIPFLLVGLPAVAAQVPVKVLFLTGSSWIKKDLKKHLDGARRIYQDCDVQFGPVRIFEQAGTQTVFNKYLSTNDGKPHLEELYQQTSQEFKDAEGLALFLLDGFYDSGSQTPFSYAEFEYPAKDKGNIPYDSIWLPAYINTQEYQSEHPYSVLAHEMAHVFLRDGQHNNDPIPDILTIWRRRNNRITHLCSKIQKNPLVHPETSVTLLHAEKLKKDFKGLQEKLDRIWKHISQSIAKIDFSKTQAPTIYFSPFDPKVQSSEWTRWQRQWSLGNAQIWKDYFCNTPRGCQEKLDWKWILENLEQINPFPTSFQAFHYDSTDRIQVNPSPTFYAFYQNDPYGIPKDFMGKGYYVSAHEMLHYALEQTDIEPKLHHCLFVSSFNGKPSLMNRVADFLVENKMSSPAIHRVGVGAEASLNPCAGFSEKEKAEVEKAFLILDAE